MKKRYKILITVIAFILIAAAAFTIWLLNPYQAVEEASAVIEKEFVEITEEEWILFNCLERNQRGQPFSVWILRFSKRR
mgnify:CR=1 FL=1